MMFISHIAILIFCFVGIFADPWRMEDRPPSSTTKSRQEERPDDDDQFSPPPSSPSPLPPSSSTEGCRGDGCRPPPNLVGPIVGSLSGILGLAIIAVFIIWFYLRRKHKKPKELNQSAPPITYVERPPLYTGAISVTDSTSRLYGKSLSQTDSIDSHVYEKINYGEQT